MPCVYVFKRGKNKGNVCGKRSDNDYCNQHAKHIFPFEKLPQLIISNILTNLYNLPILHAFQKLYMFSRTCKEFKITIEPTFKLLYERIKLSDRFDQYMINLTYLQRLCLLLEKGCQRCGVKRIRKIHWPIPIRVCNSCIREITISEYNLRKQYLITNFTYPIFTIVRYFEYNMKCYLIKDVEKQIQCKLDEYHLNDFKREIATDLELSTKELTKYSRTYLIKTDPDIIKVKKEYYINLALEKFDDFLEELEIVDLNFEICNNERVIINKIKRKYDYNKWYENFNKEKYLDFKTKHHYMIVYDNTISELRCMLKQHQYFKNINIRDIPGISSILEEYKSPDKGIDKLREVMQDVTNIVTKFISENNYKPFFTDVVANEIISNMLYYPNKIISDYEKFIKTYMKRFNYNNQDIQYIVKTIDMWSDVKDFIEKSNKSHQCSHCNRYFRYKELLQHNKTIYNEIKEDMLKDIKNFIKDPNINEFIITKPSKKFRQEIYYLAKTNKLVYKWFNKDITLIK
jgi:hypothetical protein